TILTHWKNWFDLWSDGHLIYYDDQTAEWEAKRLYAEDCFCRDGKIITLCAESTDDCLAWKFTLQDSRTNTAYVGSEVMYDETAVASSPPPYTDYAAPTPEQAYGYGPYSGLYGQQPANQVIIREQYGNNDSDLALGMLAGAGTGMALGSLFWVF
ncbi:hypothetical protein FD754_013620, partial [Muntiacus muntjak]